MIPMLSERQMNSNKTASITVHHAHLKNLLPFSAAQIMGHSNLKLLQNCVQPVMQSELDTMCPVRPILVLNIRNKLGTLTADVDCERYRRTGE